MAGGRQQNVDTSPYFKWENAEREYDNEAMQQDVLGTIAATGGLGATARRGCCLLRSIEHVLLFSFFFVDHTMLCVGESDQV